MIAYVAGRVTALAPDGAVVDVGGVGLEVQCTPSTLAALRVGETARVPTSLVVREDSLTLYGFADDDERATFELLQTASGVGPRLAQSVLGVLSPTALRQAIATEDLAELTRVPGIGRKGAQRIVLELAGRLTGIGEPSALAAASPGGRADWRGQVHAGLLGLGWSTREADEAVAAVAPEAEAMGPEPSVAVLLKAALQTLSRS
ncbi:MAG: holliday junction helicase RuvA [Frankiaceae bacterium]|nr:holliday junction helicase RuvA [Frankiaceae bacterium]MDX6275537.1 holliday junction helicase RuvA [Frankiales bacterium]